ncbi:MAG: hypothetical protein K8F36_12695 [Melioribacteraceae bacterium]|nr:hypothetical protein [Melioribacteraceae bacterium]
MKLIILLAVLFAPTLCAQDLTLKISLQKEIYLEKECIPIVTVLHNNTENEIKFHPQHYLSSVFELIITDSTGKRPTKLVLPQSPDFKNSNFFLPPDEDYVYSFFINSGYAHVYHKEFALRKSLNHLKAGKYQIQARYKHLKLTEKKFTSDYYIYHKISPGIEVADSVYSNIIDITIVKPDAKQLDIYKRIEAGYLSAREVGVTIKGKAEKYLDLISKYHDSPYKNNLFFYLYKLHTFAYLELINNFNQEYADLINQFPNELGTLFLFINNPELVELIDLNGKKFSEQYRKLAIEHMIKNKKISKD